MLGRSPHLCALLPVCNRFPPGVTSGLLATSIAAELLHTHTCNYKAETKWRHTLTQPTHHPSVVLYFLIFSIDMQHN